MKTSTKKWLMLAAMLMIIGALLFVVTMTAVEWSFHAISTDKYEIKEHFLTDEFNSVSINTDTADIVFEPLSEGRARVVCYGDEKEIHNVSVSDGVLSISLQENKAWYEYIGINFRTPKITVCLPEKEYSALLIKGSTGDIDIAKGICFESMDITVSTGDVRNYASVSGLMKISTDTGSISAVDISAGDIELSVTTGDVTVAKAKCEGNISVGVSSGDVKLTDVVCKNLSSDGSTGDIELENVIAAGKLSIERDTGDVELDGCDAAELFIVTDTGDVEGELLSDKVFIIKTDTGDVNVPDTVSGGRCEITTDTGDVEIRIGSNN